MDVTIVLLILTRLKADGFSRNGHEKDSPERLPRKGPHRGSPERVLKKTPQNGSQKATPKGSPKGGDPLVYWVRAWTVKWQIRGSNPGRRMLLLSYNLNKNNNITRGIPLSPPKNISRGEIQGVKILLNGDWQSSLDRSTPTVESWPQLKKK